MNSPSSVADPQALAKLRGLIKDVTVAMVVTVGIDGALHSRPMATREIEPDGTLWFFTADDSLKAREIADEHQVNVVYADPRQQKYVSVSGTATIVRDPEKNRQLWIPMAKVFFPHGADDPRLALLRIQVESAEYWDAPANRMVQLFQLARAAFAGDAEPIGDHQRVDLPRFTD